MLSIRTDSQQHGSRGTNEMIDVTVTASHGEMGMVRRVSRGGPGEASL